MKTTIEIRDDLFYFAKEEALRRRITFKAVIEGQLERLKQGDAPTQEELDEERKKQAMINSLKEAGIEFDESGFPYHTRPIQGDDSSESDPDLSKQVELEDDLKRAFGYLTQN